MWSNSGNSTNSWPQWHWYFDSSPKKLHSVKSNKYRTFCCRIKAADEDMFQKPRCVKMSSLKKYLSGLHDTFLGSGCHVKISGFYCPRTQKFQYTTYENPSLNTTAHLLSIMCVIRWLAAISVHHVHVSNYDSKFSCWEGVFFSSNWPRCSAEVPNTESHLWEPRIHFIALSRLNNS